MSVHVLTFGETMACITPSDSGTIIHSRALRAGIGGAESNVAIGLSRLGVPTVWASRLGLDSIGELVKRELRAEGVGLSVVDDSGAPTGLMLKERLATGHSRISYYRTGSAASRLSPGDIPLALIDESLLVHVTGITLALSSSSAEATRQVVARARTRDIPVSFDLNHRTLLWTDFQASRDAYLGIVKHADIVFATDAEAELIVGPGSFSEMAQRILELGPRIVVLKYGAAGAFGMNSEGGVWQDAIKVNAVDTVGAGDAFAAGFLAATLDGSPLPLCLLTGAATGALACTTIGDWEGAATRADVVRLLGNAVDIR